MKRAQTSTEYLIILAVVIVIALIVVGVLGGIPSIGGGMSETTAKANLASANVAVVSYALSDLDTKLKIKNNQPEIIQVNSIKVGSQECYSINEFNLKSGETKTVTCNEVNSYGKEKDRLEISIDWTDLSNNANYVQSSKDLALVDSVSDKFLATVRQHSSWNETNMGCWSDTPDEDGFYPICTCVDLNKTRTVTSRNYSLLNNLDFERCKGLFDADFTETSSDGKGWVPISIPIKNFNDVFKGNGYVISNLYINRPEQITGLFIEIEESALITDLGLVNVEVIGNVKAASLAGQTLDSTINNCYSVGTVNGGDNYVGGLIGYSLNSNISGSYFVGTVVGDLQVGGLIGYSSGSKLLNCHSTATVSGDSNVGGLIGADSSGSSILNCYSSSNVSSTEYTGGLIGRGDSAIIDNSYFSGITISTNVYSGGICGRCASISNSYSTGPVSSPRYAGGLAGYISGTVSDSYSTSIVSCSGTTAPFFCGGLSGNGGSFSGTNTWTNHTSGTPVFCVGGFITGTNPPGCTAVQD